MHVASSVCLVGKMAQDVGMVREKRGGRGARGEDAGL